MKKTNISPNLNNLNDFHVAVVILNYNNEKDLKICANQIAQQSGVHLSIILVDNASQPRSLAFVRSWLSAWRPDAVCGPEEEVQTWVRKNTEHAQQTSVVYFVQNSINEGYSGGNNIGIRLADTLKADAVLIANPDMRINNPHYIRELCRYMFEDSTNCVVASRIIGPNGLDQNPLREASFWEELFWPRWLLRNVLKTKSYVVSCRVDQPTVVSKVSGCCMLINMDFLRSTNYLDENVFLYCEEPILSARVRAAGGKIIYVPMVKATHAHIKSEKGDGTKLMLLFIQSRKYYLKTYSGYNKPQLSFLFVAYDVLALYNRLKGFSQSILRRGMKCFA